MENILVVFCLSVVLAAILKKFNMPLIVGFLISGLLVGAGWLNDTNTTVVEYFAEYGAAFLMMAVGLEINFKHFKKIGRTIILMGLMHAVLFFILTYGLFSIFGYPFLTAVIFSAVLTFSSTILVATVLRDKKEMNSLHGRVLVGILLLQDLMVAILIFMLPFVTGNLKGEYGEMAARLLFVILSVVVLIVVGRWLFGWIKDLYRKDYSVVFLLAISWLMLWMEVFGWEIFNVPVEIVGLAVGLSMAGVFETDRIANWFDPIKDYFLVFLFFYVGMHVEFQWIYHDWSAILKLFILVMVVKSVLGWITASVARMPGKVIMITGFGLANISELGFVILPLSWRLGIVSEEQMSIISVVILLTLVASSLILYNSNDLCNGFCGFFQLLERRKIFAKFEKSWQLKGKKVLVGCHRAGMAVLKSLDKNGKDVVILDYDISIVQQLRSMGYNALLADVSDKRFLTEIGINQAKMVVITIPVVKESIGLIEYIRNDCEQKCPYFIAVAGVKHETDELYKAGCDLVIDKYISVASDLSDVILTKNRRRYELKVKKNQERVYNLVIN